MGVVPPGATEAWPSSRGALATGGPPPARERNPPGRSREDSAIGSNRTIRFIRSSAKLLGARGNTLQSSVPHLAARLLVAAEARSRHDRPAHGTSSLFDLDDRRRVFQGIFAAERRLLITLRFHCALVIRRLHELPHGGNRIDSDARSDPLEEFREARGHHEFDDSRCPDRRHDRSQRPHAG